MTQGRDTEPLTRALPEKRPEGPEQLPLNTPAITFSLQSGFHCPSAAIDADSEGRGLNQFDYFHKSVSVQIIYCVQYHTGTYCNQQDVRRHANVPVPRRRRGQICQDLRLEIIIDYVTR